METNHETTFPFFFSPEEFEVLAGIDFPNIPTSLDLEEIRNNEMLSNSVVDTFIACLICISDYRRAQSHTTENLLSREGQLRSNRFCFIPSSSSIAITADIFGDWIYDPLQQSLLLEDRNSPLYQVDSFTNIGLSKEYLNRCQFDLTANWGMPSIEKKPFETDSHFSKRLMIQEYQAVAGSVVVMPRVFNSHWTLSIYDPHSKKHVFYDSLATKTHWKLWRTIFLVHYSRALSRGIELIGNQEKADQVRTVIAIHPSYIGIKESEVHSVFDRPAALKYPHQTDPVNCGAFVCYYAWKIITYQEFDPERSKWFGRSEECSSEYIGQVIRPALYNFFTKFLKFRLFQ